MDYRVGLSIAAVCLSLWVGAQDTVPYRLTIVSPDGEAVAGAEVYVEEQKRVFRADRSGKVQVFAAEPSDTLAVTIYATGYLVAQAQVRGDTMLKLGSLTQDIEAVTITAQAHEREALYRLRAVEGTAIYAGRKTEVVSLDALTVNLASNQARQLYAEVSGLNIYEGDDAGLQLNIGGRGLDPNRTANFNTRQNGYDISADVLGYPESYYSPPAEALARIEVVRGAASLQYGTQFGGLVNFVFREPDRSKRLSVVSRQTVGSNGLFTSFNSVSGQAGPVGYYGFYNYKRGDGYRPNSGFEAHNAFLHIDYAPAFTPKTKVSFEYTHLDYLAQQAGGLTDAQFYRDPFSSNRSRNYFEVDWRLYNLGIEQKIGERTEASLNVFGLDAVRQAVGFRTNRVSQIDDPDAPRDLIRGDFENRGAEARLLHRYRIGGRQAIALLGAKYYRANNASLQGPGTAASEADFGLAGDRFPSYPNQSEFRFPNRNVALFAEHIYYLNDRLSVTPGLRYEYIRTQSEGSYRRVDFDLAGNPIRNDQFRDDRVFERDLLLLGLGLSYRQTERLEYFANVSENYRSVTFNDIRTVNPSFQVDPDISDERGYTIDVGLRGRARRLRYDANVFVLRYGDRLGEVLTPEKRVDASGEVSPTGRIVRLRGNIGSALIYGLESLLEYTLLSRDDEDSPDYRLLLFANTSLTDSRYTDSQIAGVADNEVEFVPRINARGGLRFGYGSLLGSLQYSYLSEQFTDASNAPQDQGDNQSGIVGSIPAYGVLDLSLAYRYRRFDLEAGVNNLTDRTYFTRRATGYPGPGIIPSAPITAYLTVGVRL